MASILFINRYFWPDTSATAQMLTDLAIDLAASGHKVVVLAGRYSYQHADTALPLADNHGGVVIRRLRSSNFGRFSRLGRMVDYISFYLSAIATVLWRCGRGAIVVVKTDPPLLSVPIAALSLLKGFKLVNWIQDLFPEVAANAGIGLARGRAGAWLMQMRDWSLRQAAMNVVIGEQMHSALWRRGISSAQLRVICNWGLAPLASGPPIGLRSQWHLSDRFVVMYSGNMGEAHDHETIIQAVERLANDPEVTFLFVGGGTKLRRLLDRTHELGLPNVQSYPLQAREHILESLQVGDLHLISLRPEFDSQIVPSKYYGILGAGRPAVFIGSFDNEISCEILRENIGCVVLQGDVDALVASILDAKNRPQHRHQQGERARALFESRYTRLAAIRQWSALIESIDAQ